MKNKTKSRIDNTKIIDNERSIKWSLNEIINVQYNYFKILLNVNKNGTGGVNIEYNNN